MITSDLCTDVLNELGMPGIGQTPRQDDVEFVRGKLNRLLDNWNAERPAVYTETFADYTFTPNLSPHTIGPSGTFTVTQRPVSLEAASVIFTTVSPNILMPIRLRDQAWYAAQPDPALSETFPTDLYYAPVWPNGNLYFWGIPSQAYGVRLWTRTVLGALALSDAFSLPPGYQDAITLTLAEDCAPAFGRPVDPMLSQKAVKARARIFANNVHAPRLRTADAGIPSSGGRDSTFNYLSRTWGS